MRRRWISVSGLVLVTVLFGLQAQVGAAPPVKDDTRISARFCERHPLRCVTLTDPVPAPPSGTDNVFADVTWYVDPQSHARREAAALRASDPTAAALFDKIGDHAQADWFGDWNGTATVAGAVGARVRVIEDAGALPVFVLYAIPGRDCNGYSGGGMPSAAAYRTWMREVAKGLGQSKAAIILEPDALALMDCLSQAQRSERLGLLADAVDVLTENRNLAVYLDAGHSGWHGAATMAERLRAAGVAGARGFALNVSNFNTTSRELAYGRDLAGRLDGKHFVIDTSRNGLGPSSEPEAWCNPSGRALGERPTHATGDALADAYLWIKRPGESDGACKGGPAAGVWWPEYAKGLAERAAW
jgi:endoglucanase